MASDPSGSADPAPTASPMDTSAAEETIERLSAAIGCDLVEPPEVPGARGPLFEDWPFEASADCSIGGHIAARVHVLGSQEDVQSVRSRLAARYLFTEDRAACSVDPAVVLGDMWIVLVADRSNAPDVAEATSGEVDQGAERGPVVSYMPALPC